MEKIEIWSILKRHFLSLFSREDDKLPISDFLIFIAVPLLSGYLFSHDLVHLDDKFYSAAISCYSIFAALLLSVQMALFGIFQRRGPDNGGKQEQQELDTIAERKLLIRELNANVSFLILLSIVSVVFSVFFLVMNISDCVEIFISTVVMTHFVLTVFLVVKRTYILFDREYQG